MYIVQTGYGGNELTPEYNKTETPLQSPTHVTTLQIYVDTFLQIAIHDGTQIDTRPLNVLFKRFEKLSYFET